MTRHPNPTALEKAALVCLALFVALLLALYVANSADSSPRRPSQRTIDRTAEAERMLPRGILARHRAYERAQRRCYSRDWNRGKGQVCGPHQILVWDKTTRDGKRLGMIVKGRLGGAAAGALLMDDSRTWCAARPGVCPCPWARINWGDRVRLCAKLAPQASGGES